MVGKDAYKYGIFTLHFATINTLTGSLTFFTFFEFTLHFATINTLYNDISDVEDIYLHYTLLLLIHT